MRGVASRAPAAHVTTAMSSIRDPYPGRLRPLPSRSELEWRWLQLTRVDLPFAAAGRGWPLKHDHCFQRVLLDGACEGCWYEHVAGRPAYRHASDALLTRAVELGERLLAGELDLGEMNRRSLSWRGRLR